MNRNIEHIDHFTDSMPFEIFARFARPGFRMPVYRILPADFLTPTMIYLRLRGQGKMSFLLESVVKGRQKGRYSFIGFNPKTHLTQIGTETSARPTSFFTRLQKHLKENRAIHVPELPGFTGGAVGYLGFDMIRHIEQIPTAKPDTLNIPDAMLGFYDTLIAFDHVKNQIFLITLVKVSDLSRLPQQYNNAVRYLNGLQTKILSEKDFLLHPFLAHLHTLKSNQSKAQFQRAVRTLIHHIYAGDIFQAVLSQRFSLNYSGDVFQVYRALRSINPSPYMFFMDFLTFQFLGTSPEPLIRLEQDRLESIPIAGTRPRGRDENEDKRLAEQLLNDPKEKAEHIMLVDLARNDLSRVCLPGSVNVSDLLTVERYSHVMHLISRVSGKLKKEATALDALKAAFPAGTVSGAPKIRAMELINALEPHKRSFYAGSVGYFAYSGNMDQCIAIRSMVAKDGILHWQAGAGIVADSKPEREYEETLNKSLALLQAVRKASGDAK